MSHVRPTRQHAIVLGASLSGLLTARVLSSHFARVTVIERDIVDPEPTARKGQPQARHLHGLLASGLEQMTAYFPDLPDALRAAGAIVEDLATGMNWYTYGGYRQRLSLGLNSSLMSRPLLESLIRARTLALPNLTLIDACAVLDLTASPDRSRVTGARLERRSEPEGSQTLEADLVVDCTGRGSRAPQWLSALGYTAPRESIVRVDVGYATRLYKRQPGDALGSAWTLVTPEAPRETRFGGMFPIEGDRWIVSVGGWQGDHAPTDEKGFNDYVRQLPSPDIHRVISQAEPISEITAFKYPFSVRRHFEALRHFPAGLLALGDAICSFNPTYGQGMTSAAKQAAELDRLLAGDVAEPDLARLFFKRAARIIDIPWQLAVGEDFRYPSTTGPKPFGIDLLNRYVAAVHRATLVDVEVCRAFLKVMNLIEPPASLMAPRILIRVLRANRQLNRQASQQPDKALAAA
ncbi:MAG: FAD-dependent monooxygenase [Anaerolineales bacterium]|nr:FAD-dependent monooxygenase [Anaerolineales bacterium]